MIKACGEECHAEILPAPDIAKAASRADVILTATPAREPVLRREWIRPGTHISCVGADMCGKQELDSDIIAAAAVFVDDQTQSTTVGEYLYTKMPDNLAPLLSQPYFWVSS